MQVYYHSCFDNGFPDAVEGKQRIPAHVLKKVKYCSLFTDLTDLVTDVGEEDVANWMIDCPIAIIRSQEGESWTPSQAVVTRLRDIIDRIALYISDMATVTVHLDLSGHAIDHRVADENGDLVDPFTWLGVPHTQEMEDRLASIAHLPTLLRFTTESLTVLPVKIELVHLTALWWSKANNSAELKSNLQAIRAGLESEIVQPEASPSPESVQWRLHYTPEALDWRDCFAEFVELFIR